MERKYDKVFSLLYLNYRQENMSLQFQIYQSILTVPQSNTLSHKLLFFWFQPSPSGGSGTSVASKPANGSQGNQTLDECNQDALKAHNELRAKHGVPPVTLAKVILRIYLSVILGRFFVCFFFLTKQNIHSVFKQEQNYHEY